MQNAMLLWMLRDSVRAWVRKRRCLCVCAWRRKSERFCVCVGTQEAMFMFLCVRLRETERERSVDMFLCVRLRGDKVRKAVCISVRVYARGDVSVCAFGGGRMREAVCEVSVDVLTACTHTHKVCVCVRGAL
ncbi:unnamed protein product [Arctogadus glacialis]